MIPKSFNVTYNDIDYSFFFGLDLYNCPNEKWTYKGNHHDNNDKAYEEFSLRIIKPKDPKSRPFVMFCSCTAKVYDENYVNFIFKGCKKTRENILLVLNILEKYYGNNLRIDPNFTEQKYSNDLMNLHSTYKWINITKKCIKQIVANIQILPRSNTFEMSVNVPLINKNSIIEEGSITPQIDRIIIFDIETTGLIPGRHCILQLSYQVINYAKWRVIKTVNHYFDFPEDPSRVDEFAIFKNRLNKQYIDSQKTFNISEALRKFFKDLEACQLAIAHNLEFDKAFLERSALEYGIDSVKNWPYQIDTMVDTINFCKLYPKVNNEYKWPKLNELALKLDVKYNENNLHDSKYDVELTKLCFRKLCKIGFYQFRSQI